MTRSLVLEVPEDVYKPLAETAERTNREVEELAVELLTVATRRAADDPVENFIGAFASDTPDWADEHDKYIGQGLHLEIPEEEEDGSKR